jgi:hypothetical protein
MQLRNGKQSQYRPIKSRGFNVRGRADSPASSNVLVTSNAAIQILGTSHNVHVLPPLVNGSTLSTDLVNARAIELMLDGLIGTTLPAKALDKQFHKYLLIGYGADYLYYAQAPIDTREPRANPAKPKKNAQLVDAPDDDMIEVEILITGPVTGGKDTPGRDTVMGGSALNYAKAAFDEGWADERKWEWLHILGHALGGDNEVDNLVAGTFDGNTAMIPHEKRVRDLSQAATALNPIRLKYQVILFPETRVALDIAMNYDGTWHYFRTSSSLIFDKLQYDLWSM